MWDDVATSVVALLGVAGAAGLFARRATRRTVALKAQAELWAVLPPGSGRTELKTYLNERAAAHVADLRAADKDWTKRALGTFDGLMLPSGATAVVGLALSTIGNELISSVGLVLFLAAAAVVLAGMALLVVAGLVQLGRWGRKP